MQQQQQQDGDGDEEPPARSPAGGLAGGAGSSKGSRSNYDPRSDATGFEFDLQANSRGPNKVSNKKVVNKKALAGKRGVQRKQRQWWCLFMCRA